MDLVGRASDDSFSTSITGVGRSRASSGVTTSTVRTPYVVQVVPGRGKAHRLVRCRKLVSQPIRER